MRLTFGFYAHLAPKTGSHFLGCAPVRLREQRPMDADAVNIELKIRSRLPARLLSEFHRPVISMRPFRPNMARHVLQILPTKILK